MNNALLSSLYLNTIIWMYANLSFPVMGGAWECFEDNINKPYPVFGDVVPHEKQQSEKLIYRIRRITYSCASHNKQTNKQKSHSHSNRKNIGNYKFSLLHCADYMFRYGKLLHISVFPTVANLNSIW